MILEQKQPLFLLKDAHFDFANPEFVFGAHLKFLVSDFLLMDSMLNQFLA